MRTVIGTILANKTVSSLSDVKQLGSALSQVTLVKEEVTVDIQVKKRNRTRSKMLKVVSECVQNTTHKNKTKKYQFRQPPRKIKERGQHPDFLGVRSFRLQPRILSGEDNLILPARVANHSEGYGLSRLLVVHVAIRDIVKHSHLTSKLRFWG